MNGGRVTLQQIAEETGYSANTVSRALKNQSVIAKATRLRIQEAARRLGYVPNQAATSLRLGQTHSIALIVENLSNPFFGMLFEHVDHAAAELGYTVVLFSSHYHGSDEEKAIRTAISYGVDGIVLIPSHTAEQSLSFVRERQTPVVLLARQLAHAQTDSAALADYTAGALAAGHLLEAGHRRFIYTSDSGRIPSITQRLRGFESALAQADLDPQRCLHVLHGQENADATAAGVARLVREERYTAVASFCDMQARGLLARLRRHGIHAPDDIGIIAFDNLDEFVPSPQPFCSVGGDYQAMCAEAVRLLDGRIHGAEAASCTQFPPFVACRESCHLKTGL